MDGLLWSIDVGGLVLGLGLARKLLIEQEKSMMTLSGAKKNT